MSKDHKSMGPEERDPRVSVYDVPHRITSVSLLKLLLLAPFGDVIQARGSRLTMFRHQQKISLFT
jgi:hypothetical protein